MAERTDQGLVRGNEAVAPVCHGLLICLPVAFF